jgi:hypothetical protein
MQDISLLTTIVPRTLDTKSKIFGLELMDVLLIFLNISIQNLVFGATRLKMPMVFGTSLILIGIFYFLKRGKPEKYLQHLFEHTVSPTIRYANAIDRQYEKFIQEVIQ